MSPSSPSSRVPGQHHGNLRRALLDAALDAIQSSDGEVPSLRTIAKRVGVSPSATYHHFKGKEGLLAAIAQDGFEQLASVQNEVLAQYADEPAEMLSVLCMRYVLFACDHATHYRVMFAKSPALIHDDLEGVAMETFQTLVRAVGRVAVGSSEVEVLRRSFDVWALTHGAVSVLTSGLSNRLLPDTEGPQETAERIGQHALVLASMPPRGSSQES